MTPQSPPPPLRTVSFGATGPGAWGAAWLPAPDAPGLLILGRGAEAQTLEARLEADEPHGLWQVNTEAGRLMIEPGGEPVEMVPRDGSPSGLQQLCRVSGDALGAGRRAEQAFGRRGECVAAGALERYDSIREVSAWFADDEAATVIALRPRKQRGHEQDEVGGVVIVPEGWGPVVDPRLSTTYTAAGEPTRVGLELWPEDPEQHPRRLAGESLGPGVWAAAGGWELLAQPMQCHSRGRDGIGVYLIARHA
jgi:hypothetical protein